MATTAAAEPAARWDGAALDGAGRDAFAFRVVPMFGAGVSYPGAVYFNAYSRAGERRHLVAALDGKLFDGPADGGPPELAVDLREVLAPALGVGREGVGLQLLSTLFEPDLARRPFLYAHVIVTRPGESRVVVWRFDLAGREGALSVARPREVISWPSSGHCGGDLAWGPRDGMLYISAGDRSPPGDPDNVGQRVDDIFGSILRLDVRGAGGAVVPADNPFVGREGVRPEIWSYGLRNPWRMTFHPTRHELWVADNGDESWELVHRVERGANAGWSAFEGSQVFRPGNRLGGPTMVHTPAIVQHPHSEMRSVIGGIFYRGAALPELRGHYVYGCYFTKRLWAFDYRGAPQPGEPFALADAGHDVVAITEGHDREPVITCHDGTLLRLQRAAARAPGRPWPAKLSATGLFADTPSHAPAPGVIRFHVNAPAWSDGATKERMVALAGGAPMRALGGIESHKSWELPQGSALLQTLSLGDRRVETQVLYYDGTWRGYTYQWQPDGRDATLVPSGGSEAELELGDGRKQRWRFASRAECLTCHTHRSNFALSLNTRQLDRSLPGGGDQIDRLVDRGLLADNHPLRARRGQPQTDPGDSSSALAARARSYLHVNCAHCHRESGLGGRAGFQLLDDLPLERTGIVDAKPVVGLLGRPDARIVAPGDPQRSELLHRMTRRGAGQMPLIGSEVVDEAGVSLIREWIRALAPGGGARAEERERQR